MNVSLDDEVRHCLDVTQEITEHYRQYVLDPEFPRSVDGLLGICNDFLGRTIKFGFIEQPPVVPRPDRAPVPPSLFRGCYMAVSDTHSEIYLRDGMNPCWNRFVLCKELFHVLLEREDNRTMDMYEHLREVTMKFPEEGAQPSPAAISEQLAEVAAMEFLFPYEERVYYLRKAVADGGLDALAIAKRYRIPQVYVEQYLSDPWIRYMGAFLIK